MHAPYRQKLFHSADVNLSYIESPPNGEPFLLIHGVTSRYQSFQPVLPNLIENYQIYALDLRGHGGSGHMPGSYHLDDFTRDVEQFMDYTVSTPPVIYGHSLGALVAINLAARHPQNIRKLILGDPPLYYWNTPTRETFWHKAFIDLLEFMTANPTPGAMRAWLAENMPNMAPERVEERVRSLEGLDPDVVRAVISDEVMKGVSLSTLARRVTCPVFLLRGNQRLGSALREQDVDFAVSHFPDIRVIEMETVGHGIPAASLLLQLIHSSRME